MDGNNLRGRGGRVAYPVKKLNPGKKKNGKLLAAVVASIIP